MSVPLSVRIVLIAALVACAAPAQAEEPVATAFEDLAPAPAKIPESDLELFRDRLIAPLRPGGLGLLAAMGAGAALGEDMENPEQEVAFLEARPFERVSDIGNFWGAGETTLVPAVLLWTAGSAVDSPRMTDLGRDLTATFAATGLYTWALKSTARRPRPSGGGNFSFPSGHTAVAFGTATVLQRHFGWKVGTVAYALATGTAAARMEDSRHYFSDVCFGAALGMAVGGVELPFGWWATVRDHVDVDVRGLSWRIGF